MGTFERIRQISPYFFGLMAILLIAYFVFTSGGEEIAQQQLGNPQTAVIAAVNGEDILRSLFESRVAERREQMRTQQGENADIDENSIRKEVWDELIEETILNQEAKKAGIIVTDEEINDILIENPPDYLKKGFSDSAGNFNRQIYLELITNPDNYANYLPQASPEEKVEVVNTFRKNLILVSDYLRKQKMAERLSNLMAFASSNFSQTYATEKYIGENSTADVEYVLFDISQIPENTIKVSDNEIKKYYEERKKYYKQKPQRKIKYVAFPIVPSRTDSSKAEKRIEIVLRDLEAGKTIHERDSIFDEKLNQFNGTSTSFILAKDLPPSKMNYILQLQEREVLGPVNIEDATYFFRLDGKRKADSEVVKASHILVTFNNNKDSAKKEIEKILKQVKAGEDFAKAAMKYSSDPGSNKNGGDLGYFSKGQMVKEFEKAAFAAKPGEIVGPIETDYGYHIIKVTDKKSEEVAFSEIMIKPTISSITNNLIKREALSFKSQIEEGVNFDTLAKRLNLNAVETAFFDNTRPVLGSQYLTNISFENEVGTILEPFELPYYGLIVAKITNAREGEIKPLEDVKEAIKAKIIKRKRLDALKSEVYKVYNKIKEANSLTVAADFNPIYQVKTITGMNNTGIVAGLGQSFALAAKVFSIPPGKISEPIRDEKGYFIIKVLSRNILDASKVKEEIKNYISQQKASTKQSAFYQWINKLKEQAEIVDYRSKYYREF